MVRGAARGRGAARRARIRLHHRDRPRLDETFEQQAQIAIDVKNSLDESMRELGYNIVKSLITDIVPDDARRGARRQSASAMSCRRAGSSGLVGGG